MGVFIKNVNAKGIIAPTQGIRALTNGGTSFTTTNTLQVVPSSAIFSPGDLLVNIIVDGSGGGITWTPPAGWTEVVDMGSVPDLNIAYRTATAANIGVNNTFSAVVSTSGISVLLGFRGGAWDAIGTVTTSTGTTAMTIPSVTTTQNNSFVVALIAGNVVGATSNFNLPLIQFETQFGGSACIQIGYLLQTTAGASGTRSLGFNTATGSNAGIQFSVKPR